MFTGRTDSSDAFSTVLYNYKINYYLNQDSCLRTSGLYVLYMICNDQQIFFKCLENNTEVVIQ